METQHIIIVVLILALLFCFYNQRNEGLRPVVHVTKGRPGTKCGTAFVNMSYDHSESEKLYKTCPEGYGCKNDTCVAAPDKELQGYEEYKYLEYDVA